VTTAVVPVIAGSTAVCQLALRDQDGEVVVALVRERHHVVGVEPADDPPHLGADTLAPVDADDPANDQVGDGIEGRVLQDQITVDAREDTRLFGLLAVHEQGIAVEAVDALRRGLELDPEVELLLRVGLARLVHATADLAYVVAGFIVLAYRVPPVAPTRHRSEELWADVHDAGIDPGLVAELGQPADLDEVFEHTLRVLVEAILTEPD